MLRKRQAIIRCGGRGCPASYKLHVAGVGSQGMIARLERLLKLQGWVQARDAWYCPCHRPALESAEMDRLEGQLDNPERRERAAAQMRGGKS